jgi:hypothetical protein
MSRGKVIWQGVVEAFSLTGHPKAKKAYGWRTGEGVKTRLVTVLELPPVDSPNTAVRAILASQTNK